MVNGSTARVCAGRVGHYNRSAMAALAVGDTAPDFDLPVSNTERVQLTSLLEKGPVVLLVYVFDFSPG